MQINELSLIIYTYRCDLEKQEKLDGSYTQRRKPYEGGDRGTDDMKKTKGKETIGERQKTGKSGEYGSQEPASRQNTNDDIYHRMLTFSAVSFIFCLDFLFVTLFRFIIVFSSFFSCLGKSGISKRFLLTIILSHTL